MCYNCIWLQTLCLLKVTEELKKRDTLQGKITKRLALLWSCFTTEFCYRWLRSSKIATLCNPKSRHISVWSKRRRSASRECRKNKIHSNMKKTPPYEACTITKNIKEIASECNTRTKRIQWEERRSKKKTLLQEQQCVIYRKWRSALI